MRFFTEASPLRKAILATGVIALVAGAVLIGVAAFSALGGDDGEDIEVRDLTSPTPTRAATATRTARESITPQPTPPPPPPLAEGQYAMIIEKLGVSAPVQTYGLDSQSIPEVPTGADAADIVAWYNFSAQPGTGSNAVFAGHVTWFGPGVFYNLETMADGDEIKLLGHDGTELIYRVNDVFQVDARDPDSLQVMHGTDQDILTIITCDGDFIDTNDPIFGGDYTLRLVVRAERVQPAVSAP
jgi:LPXTG-site transpeptidase (sortase) family protein